MRSKLRLEFECLYLRLLFPEGKHSPGAAKKRYGGLVQTPGGTQVVLTGLEAVRRDWTALARRVQRDLYERLFHDRDVSDYLRDLVAQVREGACDDELVYRKTLRRATWPRHAR